MATEYNITQKQYNGTDYDILYPLTNSKQVLLKDTNILGGGNTIHEALLEITNRLNFQTQISVDTLLTTGIHYCYNCTNVPSIQSVDTWLIIVISDGSSYAKQIATTLSNRNIHYERILSAGTWGSWSLLRDRFTVATNSTQTVPIATYSYYFVTVAGHLWFVYSTGTSTVPTVVSLYGTSGNLSCTASAGPNIILDNTSSNNYTFEITYV